MNLSELRPPKGQVRKPKRVGRGMGSGLGKTAGRGEKGQRSRSGFRHKRGFEGGQMPLHRRVPKRGFHNIFKKKFAVVNLDTLARLEGADTITPELLQERGVFRRLRDGLRVLGDGELSRAVTVRAHHFSQSARRKIEAAGGKAELIGADGKPVAAAPAAPRPAPLGPAEGKGKAKAPAGEGTAVEPAVEAGRTEAAGEGGLAQAAQPAQPAKSARPAKPAVKGSPKKPAGAGRSAK